MRGCVKVIHKHCTISCKGFEHLQILVSMGKVWKQSPVDSKGQLFFPTVTMFLWLVGKWFYSRVHLLNYLGLPCVSHDISLTAETEYPTPNVKGERVYLAHSL